MSNEKKEYTILWLIENYSYCWHKNGEKLISPNFTVGGLEGFLWNLELYPRGYSILDKSHVSVFLNASKTDKGPGDFLLNYELSFLASNGSTLKSNKAECSFIKEARNGCWKFVQIDEVQSKKKAVYLPQDTLSLRCKLWRGVGNVKQISEITVRTRIGIEHITFNHFIEDFSKLESNQKKTIWITSTVQTPVLSSSVYLTNCDSCEEKVIVEITPFDENKILSKCKLYLLGGDFGEVEFGGVDNTIDPTRKDIRKVPLSLTWKNILDNFYIEDDKLNLKCVCTFSTGVEFEKIETIVHKTPFVSFNQMDNNDTENLYDCPSALDDFKATYSDHSLSDVELKTNTKSFPAHKFVLYARSSVFKAMLTNDMKEKNRNSIQVDDLEDDTVQQLLLFLYSDNVNNLEWESAIKLYYAGDKYAIEKLKMLCSSFLVRNLSVSKASELLLLADTHSDPHLKKAVEDFIFKHQGPIYNSDEWRKLIETSSLLVSKTMLLMFNRKK